jgi:signal peptidase I
VRWRWVLTAAGLAAAAAALGRARPFRVEVRGRSMAPTLEPGDWLVAARASTIRRGDVVVVRHPAGAFDVVKRVVALPDERAHGIELGPDEYLVVGDNVTGSTDGRAFGPVKREAIDGVVRLRYWPRPRPIGSR